MFSFMNARLPFLEKSFNELGLLGKVSYICSAIAAIVAGIAAVWQVIGWANHKLELSDQLVLWEVQSTLNIEKEMIKSDPSQTERYNQILKQLEELDKISKD